MEASSKVCFCSTWYDYIVDSYILHVVNVFADELWRHVGALGVHRNKRHPQFEAMPQDLIDDFVRKRYLKVEKVPGAEEEKKLYTAAENAVYDVTEEMVQQFVETEMRDMIH